MFQTTWYAIARSRSGCWGRPKYQLHVSLQETDGNQLKKALVVASTLNVQPCGNNAGRWCTELQADNCQSQSLRETQWHSLTLSVLICAFAFEEKKGQALTGSSTIQHGLLEFRPLLVFGSNGCGRVDPIPDWSDLFLIYFMLTNPLFWVEKSGPVF